MAIAPSQEQEASSTPAYPSLKEKLTIARDAGKLLLEVALIILVIYCLFRPQIVRSWLSQLGISKMTLLGMELTPASEQEIANTIQSLTQERDQARDENRQLRDGASETLTQLEALRRAQPAQSPQAQEVQRLIQDITPIATTPAARPAAPSRVQQNIIQGARENVGGNAQWAVVFGGDRTQEAAADEIQWAHANGLPTARLMLRQNYYRSVALADTAQSAATMLETARARRPEAYVVNLVTWCARREAGQEFDRCP